MSTFHEKKINATSAVTCLCWKQTTPCYVAIGTSKGSVNFYWSDCTECDFPPLSYQSRTSKARHVTSLTFHPIYDVLIAIWSDGVMRSWNCHKGIVSSQMSPHSVKSSAFLNVLFNQNGSRLVTTDYRGVISMWLCKPNGSLNLLYTFKLKHGCSHITLYQLQTPPEEETEEELALSAFYMSSKEGKLYVTTDDGHCNEILQVEHREIHFKLLQYISEYQKLVFITHHIDLMLYIYDVADGNLSELTLDKSYKLSIKSTDDVQLICLYLFNGLIAICNEQCIVRLFDIINNENYILSLTDARHMAAPNDTIDTIKFMPSTKVLAGITNKNRVVLWKYKYSQWSTRQLMYQTSNENDWIVLPPINIQRKILLMDGGLSSQFYNSNDIALTMFMETNPGNTSTNKNAPALAASNSDDNSGELKVFCETQLHHKYSNGYTFIQFAPNRLLIYLSDDKMKKIRTPFTILIVANAGNLVFLSNGELAQLYLLDRESAPIRIYQWDEMLCSMACVHLLDDTSSSASMKESDSKQPIASSSTSSLSSTENNSNANRRKTPSANIIVCYHNNIRIYNCNGSMKTTLTLQEYEGFPLSMDISGSLLAVVTTENILKVWDLNGDSNQDLNKRVPKLIVPQRKLDEYVNGVQSIKLNATADKISILSESPSDGQHNMITTVFLYDIEKDDIAKFKLQPDLTVQDHIWEQHDGRFLSVLFRKIASPGNKNKKKLVHGGNGAQNSDDSSDESDETSMLPAAHERGGSVDIDIDGHSSKHMKGDSASSEFSADALRRTSETFVTSMQHTRKESMLEMTNSEAELAGEMDYGVLSFFIAPNGVILPQEMFPTKYKYVGLQVPDFIFISTPNTDDNTSKVAAAGAMNKGNNATPKIIRKRIRDFIGINDIDEQTKNNLMNFSYFLTVGDLDEAYRSVQNIKSASVWQNMARMCVKTRRLDVAQICISNLSSSRGTSATIASSLFVDDESDKMLGGEERTEEEQHALRENEKHLKLAMVAVDLKMYEDAEELLTQCARYDLVLKMYQALGRWTSAIQICEKYDRVNLNAAYYQYASYLQESGKIENAIQYYEKSQCPLQIAQMLYAHKQLQLLHNYVNRSKDTKLLKWYAKLLESNEEYNAALSYYEKANDYVSMVRLCCETGDIQRAESMVNSSKSKGAAFHLASYYEDNEQVNKAIDFYQISTGYHHALRLAKEHNLEELLIDIALKVPDSVLTSRSNPKEVAARYFEEIGDLSKAVMLFEKAGNINKAMELCIEGQLFDQLRNIASSLTNASSNIDPSVALRFSEYFLQHEQYEKAVSMLIIARQYTEALHIISNYGIPLTKQLAEKLSPPKSDGDQTQRKAVLMHLAKCLIEQQQYQLACKKYTQCGEKLKAIQCLIKAGDTTKVIYYASKTKNKDTYILAANYLQSVDWHSNAEYTKYILQFYNSAKAYEQMAFFYDGMAQIEIDDYRDYDKALRALKQAYKQIKKSESVNKDEKLSMFEQRMNLVNKFSSARKLAESNPTQMISICEELLKQQDASNSDFEAAVRRGDVYALMVEYYFSVNDMSNAYNVIQRMVHSHIELGPYLDRTLIESVYEALGVDINQLQMASEQDVDEEVIDEEIDID